MSNPGSTYRHHLIYQSKAGKMYNLVREACPFVQVVSLLVYMVHRSNLAPE